MSESHQREAAIFDAAMDLPPEQRAAHLDHACGGDAALRQRIESLLKANESQCEFLDPPGDPALRQTLHLTVPLTEKPGDRIGRYKLLEQIGEGGCGVVYVAEQTEPVRRRVALKIIKLGMDTKSVIARFEAERQALALMDHPNIAKVFDAGSTERPLTRPSDTFSPDGGEGRGEGEAGVTEGRARHSVRAGVEQSESGAQGTDAPYLSAGRPYFVMELVRGMKITEYCDEAKLSTSARLDLFIQVCQAIQHAHQKGIIHRDIKPSNILVTVNDGVAVPKVIDFGVAKATSGQLLTDKTIYTAFEQFIGTPAYMSPEQAVLTSLDIDTRSDIYALGVLLYELLTGKTPFDAKELLAIGLDEMRRTLRDQEPPRPSTRLSTLPGEELSTTAQRRSIEAPKLVSELRGDLDWIVLKALEKDRARRYETANGLAMDIQRHLNNEPVVACPPSAAYRLQKMVRRNKLAFAAGAAVGAALILGLGTATWMFFQERAALRRAVAAEQAQKKLRQEAEAAREQAESDAKKAQTEAAKSRQVAQFLQDMLKGVGPSVAVGRDTTMLREILDRTAERVGKDLTNQPEVEMEMRLTLANTYGELGLYKQQEQMAREGSRLARSMPGSNYVTAANLLQNMAGALCHQGHFEEAEGSAREALAMKRKLLGSEAPEVVTSLICLANTLLERGNLAEAEAMNREALAMSRKFRGNEHPEVAYSLNNLAQVLEKRDILAESEALYRETLAVLRKLNGDEHPDVACVLGNLAALLHRQGELAEAEEMGREGLAMERKLLGNEHPALASSLNNLAAVLEARGKLAEAEGVYREALAMLRKLLDDEHPHVAITVDNLVRTLLKQKKPDEVEKLYNDFVSSPAGGQSNGARFLKNRSEFYARRGQWERASVDLAKVRDANPNDHEAWHRLAALLVASGQIDVYREQCRKSAERFGQSNDLLTLERIAKDCLILPASGADLGVVAKMADTVAAVTNHWATPWFQLAKGLAEYRQGRFAGAVEWTNEALTNAGSVSGAIQDDMVVEAYMVLAMAHYQLKQTDEARAFFDKGAEIERTKLPKLESGDLGGGWIDWIIAHALMREAKALIEGGSEPRAGTN